MKRLSIILIVGICTLSSALCRAESVSHNFEGMKGTTLTWTGTPTNYTIGYTDLVTYTGTDGGTFGSTGSAICISLPSTGSTMQTSPAVENLTLLTLTHTYGEAPNWIKFYVSTDNSSWTNISGSVDYGSSTIDVPMPTKGNYYIKVENTNGSKPVNFLTFRWVYDPCHCLRVVSE